MNNRCSILVCFSLPLLVLLFGITLWGAEENQNSLQAEYESLLKNFSEKMMTVNSRDSYNKLLTEHKAALKSLQEKLDKTTLADDLVLLKGKVLFDLEDLEAAAKLFESLIAKSSPVMNAAKFELVRAHLSGNKYDDALALFRQVEDKIEKNKNYIWVLLGFALSAKDNKDMEEYSYKFIKAVGNAKEYENFKAMVYENLAKIEHEKGNTKKGIEILEKAITELSLPRAQAELKSSLQQLKMLGNPAPEITAENWLNSEALTLSSLKGKAVVIDFWATWCGPCRSVMPVLAKTYNQYKDKGLVIIGFTRLYGSYSDDRGSKGKVPPEEEKKLIAEFIKRNNITYPIAVADSSTLFATYGVSGIPTMVMIDKAGNVKDVEVGSGDDQRLEMKIKSLLE